MQELRPTGQVRLAAGHHLYVGKDGGWRLAGPADTYERLRLPVTVGAALERLLTGRTVYATAIAEAGDSRTLDAALLALHERGLLTDASVTGPELEGGSAVVLGEGSIAHRVAEVLVSSGHQVRRVACPAGSDVMSPDPVSPDLDGASVVVACVCWLPDHAWQDLDVRCSRAGLAWHRCHREGTRFVLGPFSVPRHTAGYRDTRARRLAAASQPTELAALWRHLETSPPPAVHPDAAISTVVAGLLTADVIAFLADRPIPTKDAVLVLDPATMAINRHPVLPLPAEVVDGWAGDGWGAPS